jgi:hypothetical protein
MFEESGKSQDLLTTRLVGRTSVAATNVRLESRHNKQIIHQTLIKSPFISRPEEGHIVLVRQM